MNNFTVHSKNGTTESSTEGIERIVRLSFYVATFVIGMIGNIMVAVIVGKKAKRSIHEMFILNLAISDLTFLGFCLPLNSYELFEPIEKPEFHCRFVILMQTITYFISIFTITSMAIHRCYVIVNPYKPKMATRSAYVWIALIWFLSLIIVTPIAVVSRSVDGECEEQWLDPYHSKIYTAALFVLQFLLPLFITAIAYVWIGIYLVRTKGPQTYIGGKRKSANLDRKRRENKQIITTLATIVIIFTICMLPGQIAWMVRDFGTPIQQNRIEVIFKFSNILDFIHACVNPIIYGLLTDKFRKDYKAIFTRIYTCGKITVAPDNETSFQMEPSGMKHAQKNKIPSENVSTDDPKSSQTIKSLTDDTVPGDNVHYDCRL